MARLVLNRDGLLGYAKFYSRSHNAVIRVYDESGNVNPHTRARSFDSIDLTSF